LTVFVLVVAVDQIAAGRLNVLRLEFEFVQAESKRIHLLTRVAHKHAVATQDPLVAAVDAVESATVPVSLRTSQVLGMGVDKRMPIHHESLGAAHPVVLPLL